MEKNIFDGVDINRLERAMGILYSSVCGVKVKVTLVPKDEAKQKELAATSSKKQIKQKINECL